MGSTTEIVGERLRLFMEYKKVTAKELSHATGIHANVISNSLRGITKLSMPNLERLISACPDLNINWFLTGQGEMLLAEDERTMLVQEDVVRYSKSLTRTECLSALETARSYIRELESHITDLKQLDLRNETIIKDKERIIQFYESHKNE